MKYIATDPRIDTRGNSKERRSKERWMYGVRWRLANRGQREEDTRDGDMWCSFGTRYTLYNTHFLDE
jgi:hypothetical protein